MSLELRLPISLSFTAEEQPDGTWRLDYIEFFKKEDLEAFRTSVAIIENITNIDVTLDEENCAVRVVLKGSRGTVFDFLMGEFMTLSNFGSKNLREIFILSGLGAASILEGGLPRMDVHGRVILFEREKNEV